MPIPPGGDDPLPEAAPSPVHLYKVSGFGNFYENCTAATTMIYLDPSGNVLPCPFLKQLPPELGKLYSHIGSNNIMKSTFQDIWHSEAFETFRSYYDPGKSPPTNIKPPCCPLHGEPGGSSCDCRIFALRFALQDFYGRILTVRASRPLPS